MHFLLQLFLFYVCIWRIYMPIQELLHRINRDPTFSAFLIGISCLTLCVATIIFGIDVIRRRRSRQCLDKTNSDTLKVVNIGI